MPRGRRLRGAGWSGAQTGAMLAGGSATMELFEALETTRAMRRLSARPVGREALERLIYYATRAPSGGNAQPWEFVVVTRPELIAGLGELYRQSSEELFTAVVNRADASEATRRLYGSALELSRSMGRAPALILVCLRGRPPADPAMAAGRYASIFPAVQNLMLAARGMGLGTVLTTVHRRREAEVKALLAIPDDIETVALIPVGYPEGRFGPVRRRPVSEVLHWDGF